MNDVFAFGLALMFVGLMFGLMKSLVATALQPEKETPKLLPQTERKILPEDRLRRLRWFVINRQTGKTALLIYQRGDQWEAFSFKTRQYSTIPVRNKKIQSDIASFIEQMGYSGDRYQIVTEPPIARRYAINSREISASVSQLLSRMTFPTKKETAEAYPFYIYVADLATWRAPRDIRDPAWTELLKRLESGKPTSLLPQVLIEGGEPVPSRYRHLIGWVNEPLPEYSLAVELLPAVETTTGERKIDAVMKQLKDGVETIQQSDNFRLFLSTMAKFHDYSIGNLILIMIQKPAATHVAGFNTWKDLGRWVKSGEKGIAILAPVMPSRPTCPDCGAKLRKGVRFCPQCGKEVQVEEGIEGAPRFFRVVYVFDLSQTDGKPLPEFAVPVLTGEANEELFSKVLALAKSQGLTVSFEPRPEQDPEIKGFYSGKLIWVRPEEPRAQQLKTLLHEVAHYYSEGVFQIPRRDAETIAESAAFAIGAHFGFDTGVRSFPYVALWSQDKKILEQNLAAIRKVSVTILESLEKEPAVELLPMIIKCAWCGKYMGEKPPYEDKGITHSICPECKAKHFPKKGPKHGSS